MQEIPRPSFTTLRRDADLCRGARFRKTAGQHPNCGKCMEYKKRVRALQHPEQRALVLEEYCHHVFPQWCDRGMAANCTEFSRTCRRMLELLLLRVLTACVLLC